MMQGLVKGVVEGRNGQLFISDYGADQDAILVRQPLVAQRIALWRASLERKAAFLAERSIPFVVLVAPDSFTFCADDIPAHWPRPGPIGAPFAAAMAGIANLRVVFPLDALVQASGGLPVYRKTDTHWSAYGALVGYRELLAALPADLDIRRVAPRDVSFALKDLYGNLGAVVDCKEPTLVAKVAGPQRVAVRTTTGLDRRGFSITRSPAATARALILRDSFATEMGPYLSETFGEAWLAGPATVLDPDLVEAARPDVVILQMSERRLLRFDPQYDELGWREQFDVDTRSPAGKLLARLHQAGATRDVEAAADMAPAVAAAEGLQAQHLIHCALALARAGRHEDSAAYARAALRLDKSFASAWRLVARAALARRGRDDTEWIGPARKMIRLAPHNALYRQEYARGLVWFGQVDEGVADMREAIERFPDFPGLRIQLARVLDRLGDRAGAVEMLDLALGLMPPAMTRLRDLADRLRAGGAWGAGPDPGEMLEGPDADA